MAGVLYGGVIRCHAFAAHLRRARRASYIAESAEEAEIAERVTLSGGAADGSRFARAVGGSDPRMQIARIQVRLACADQTRPPAPRHRRGAISSRSVTASAVFAVLSELRDSWQASDARQRTTWIEALCRSLAKAEARELAKPPCSEPCR